MSTFLCEQFHTFSSNLASNKTMMVSDSFVFLFWHSELTIICKNLETQIKYCTVAFHIKSVQRLRQTSSAWLLFKDLIAFFAGGVNPVIVWDKATFLGEFNITRKNSLKNVHMRHSWNDSRSGLHSFKALEGFFFNANPKGINSHE